MNPLTEATPNGAAPDELIRVPTPESGGGYSAGHDQHFQVVGPDTAGTRP